MVSSRSPMADDMMTTRRQHGGINGIKRGVLRIAFSIFVFMSISQLFTSRYALAGFRHCFQSIASWRRGARRSSPAAIIILGVTLALKAQFEVFRNKKIRSDVPSSTWGDGPGSRTANRSSLLYFILGLLETRARLSFGGGFLALSLPGESDRAYFPRGGVGWTTAHQAREYWLVSHHRGDCLLSLLIVTKLSDVSQLRERQGEGKGIPCGIRAFTCQGKRSVAN